MKIIIDDKIPYIKGALEPFAEVIYLPGTKTTPGIVRDADALITRTRTICNEALLKNSKIRYIATATIGFDHIDTRYCEKNDINWSNAPGCNAESVNQYIASAIFSYAIKKGIKLQDKTIGIVGVGNVGKRVAGLCKNLGIKTLLNDPPRQRAEDSDNFVSLERIQKECDIITFHVPLNLTGVDSTLHLVDDLFLQNLKNKPLLINSCRGEVFNSKSIKKAIVTNSISGFIADCWENEPNIDTSLLKIADFGTPHIAGYSKDGKANGTKMSVRAISRFFNLGIDNWEPSAIESPENDTININGTQQSEQSILAEAILSTYEIKNDDQRLRELPNLFEKLRGDYPVRREFNSYTIKATKVEDEVLEKLKGIGFVIDLNRKR